MQQCSTRDGDGMQVFDEKKEREGGVEMDPATAKQASQTERLLGGARFGNTHC
jgi:hypothetical protein